MAGEASFESLGGLASSRSSMHIFGDERVLSQLMSSTLHPQAESTPAFFTINGITDEAKNSCFYFTKVAFQAVSARLAERCRPASTKQLHTV